MSFFEIPVGPLRSAQAANLCYAAATTLLTYDYVLTFDEEVRTVWPSKWNTGKILFLLNRYVNLLVVYMDSITFVVVNPSAPLCRGYFGFSSLTALGLLGIVEAVLVMRTYALYGNDKTVLWSLSSLAAFAVSTMFAINLYIYINTQYVINPIPTILTGCTPTLHCSERCIRVYRFFWAPLVACDGVICAVTLYKAIQHSRNSYRTPLITVILRDGLIYYGFILGITFTNWMMWLTARLEFSQLLTELTRVLISLLCSRLLLNLKSVTSSSIFLSAKSGHTVSFNGNGCNTLPPLAFRSNLEARGESAVDSNLMNASTIVDADDSNDMREVGRGTQMQMRRLV